MSREELVASAVSFLADPKVATSPITKKIAFLESKGLTGEEVQQALNVAQSSKDVTISRGNISSGAEAYQYPVAHLAKTPPPLPPQSYAPYAVRRDWRDWFIMAVLTSGVSWVMFIFTKRYLLPLIKPPLPSELEADKNAVDAQFDQIQDMLSVLQQDTSEMRESVSAQQQKIDVALTSVETTVSDISAKASRREHDVRRLGIEVDQIRDMIPKALEQVKTAQTDSLAELQIELKSLKSLLANRAKASFTSTNIVGGSSVTNEASGVGSASSNNVARDVVQGSGLNSAAIGVTAPDSMVRSANIRSGIPAWQLPQATVDGEDKDPKENPNEKVST